MHIIFTDEEKRWVNTKTFGWPIKDGCPDGIRKSINEKKKLLDEQIGSRKYADKVLRRH